MALSISVGATLGGTGETRLMRSRSFPVVAAISALCFLAATCSGETVGADRPSAITVTMAPASEAFFTGGPVAITMEIMNGSKSAVITHTDALGPPTFDVSMIAPGGVEIHAKKRVTPGSRQRTPIAPGGRFRAVVLLSNLLPFRNPGRYEVTLSCAIGIHTTPPVPNAPETGEVIKCSQKLTLLVRTMSDAAITAYLEKEFVKLSGDDPNSFVVPIATLCCVDSPLVVPYLVKMSRMSYAQHSAVIALTRFGSAEATSALRAVLTSNYDRVVVAALEELESRGVAATDVELDALLTSDSASIRFAALSYVISRKRTISQATLSKLAQDRNPGVAKLAHQYIEGNK